MALQVENGNAAEGSNGYIDVTFFREYWVDRDVVITENELVIGGAIVSASQYVDQNFEFIGSPVTVTQGLAWPRSGVPGVTSSAVPLAVRKAVAEYTRRALSAELQRDPDNSPQVISETKIMTGLGEKSVTYAEGDTYTGLNRYPTADAYLKPYLKSRPGMMSTQLRR